MVTPMPVTGTTPSITGGELGDAPLTISTPPKEDAPPFHPSRFNHHPGSHGAHFAR